MEKLDTLINKLRQKGLKITPQRLLILKLLEGNRAHPTAEDIHNQVIKKHPTISLATVYKTLEVLTKMGEIRQLNLGQDKSRFDPDTRPAIHLICKCCNQVMDIHKDFDRRLKIPAGFKDEFVVTEKHIELYGICKKCLKKSRGVFQYAPTLHTRVKREL